jgi:hypothetical protein
METIILSGKSKKDVELVTELAKKLGLNAARISEEDLEDAGLVLAMKRGRTGRYVSREQVMKALKK